MEQDGQQARFADDLENIAQEVVKVRSDLIARVDGVRADADVALLEQVNKLVTRMERLEKLFARDVLSKVAGAEDLLVEARAR
jgi:hypothetical protein